MQANNNSKGIVLIIIAMTLFAMQDSLIKFIFEEAALYENFFGRYFVAALLLFCFIKYKNEKVSLKTYYPMLTFVRVILHFLAFSAFFISLTYMPLATANALFFSCTFFRYQRLLQQRFSRLLRLWTEKMPRLMARLQQAQYNHLEYLFLP